jgi:hypothetical protein
VITEKIEISVDGIANEASFDKFSLFLGGALKAFLGEKFSIKIIAHE